MEIIYRWIYRAKIRAFWRWLLNKYGLDGSTLRDKWLSLSREAHREIGTRAIDAYGYGINSAQIRSNSDAPWSKKWCLSEAILLACILGDMSEHKALLPAQYLHFGEVKQYITDSPVGFPIHIAQIVNEEKKFYHAVCALWIGPGATDISDYQFFSAGVPNIKTDGSNSQMPSGSTVSIAETAKEIVTFTPVSYGPVYYNGIVHYPIFKT